MGAQDVGIERIGRAIPDRLDVVTLGAPFEGQEEEEWRGALVRTRAAGGGARACAVKWRPKGRPQERSSVSAP
jgi:hypothetical protein